MNEERLVERLFELLICGDQRGASRLIANARDGGRSHDELADLTFRPLERLLSSLHRAEQLTELAHRYATDILDTLQTDDADLARDDEDHDIPPVLRFPRTVRRSMAERSVQVEDTSQDRAQFVAFSFNDGVLTASVTTPAVRERETPIVNQEIGAMLRMLGPRVQRLVIDLSQVKNMSSMGLGMLLDLKSQADTLQARTEVEGASGEMAKIMRQLNLATKRRTGRGARPQHHEGRASRFGRFPARMRVFG